MLGQAGVWGNDNIIMTLSMGSKSQEVIIS